MLMWSDVHSRGWRVTASNLNTLKLASTTICAEWKWSVEPWGGKRRMSRSGRRKAREGGKKGLTIGLRQYLRQSWLPPSTTFLPLYLACWHSPRVYLGICVLHPSSLSRKLSGRAPVWLETYYQRWTLTGWRQSPWFSFPLPVNGSGMGLQRGFATGRKDNKWMTNHYSWIKKDLKC